MRWWRHSARLWVDRRVVPWLLTLALSPKITHSVIPGHTRREVFSITVYTTVDYSQTEQDVFYSSLKARSKIIWKISERHGNW